MGNLSSPMGLTFTLAQGLNTIARNYTSNQNLEINFDFTPLPPNPTIATADPPNPPASALGIGALLKFFFLTFVYTELGRLSKQRFLGITRQYLLVGAPESTFLLVSSVLIALNVLLVTAVLCGVLGSTVFDYQGIYVVMLVSAVAIPIHNVFWYLTTSKTPEKDVR